MMDTKTKILYTGITLVMLTGIGIAADRYIIRPDYTISEEVYCDPEAEEQTCFYFVCENDWWTPCTGDPAWDIWTYKLVTKHVSEVESGVFDKPCIPGETIGEDESCPEMYCEEDETTCVTTYCDPVADGNCYTPEAVSLVDEVWRAVLLEGGIDPIEPEEEEVSIEAVPSEGEELITDTTDQDIDIEQSENEEDQQP